MCTRNFCFHSFSIYIVIWRLWYETQPNLSQINIIWKTHSKSSLCTSDFLICYFLPKKKDGKNKYFYSWKCNRLDAVPWGVVRDKQQFVCWWGWLKEMLFCSLPETQTKKCIHNEKSCTGGLLVMSHLLLASCSASWHFETVIVQSTTNLSRKQEVVKAEAKRRV